MISLKRIEIAGFRGIKELLSISLDAKQSLLIYGDNGSGKSSIADAAEWFYFDRVEHLSKEEIGRKGIEALRNKFLSVEDDATVSFDFSEDILNATKALLLKKGKLATSVTNAEEAFASYINDSQKENLILRYRDLVTFIYQSKKQKLDSLSQIIGFGNVVSTRSTLLKALNEVAKNIKTSRFDDKISQSQSQLLQQVNQPIQNDEQYYKAIENLIAPLGLRIKVVNDKSIEDVLEIIKQPENKEDILLQESYEKSITLISNIITTIQSIPEVYGEFFLKHQSISENIEDLKKLKLENILSEGYALLDEALYDEDKCPLCLQSKERNELLDELKIRIAELSELKKAKEDLLGLQQEISNLVKNVLSDVSKLKTEKCLLLKEHAKALELINQLAKYISSAAEEIKGDVLGKTIGKDLIKTDTAIIAQLSTDFAEKKNIISEKKKDDIKFDINSKITLARQLYKGIVALRAEAGALILQYDSLNAIYKEFIKRQKEGFVAFLDAISNEINELYLFMNMDEKVDEIRLIPLGSGDDFDGITFQFKLYGDVVTPPDKYLSESHLNCLGICLFLASVKAFNIRNKFFVLDDVISSFDKSHRVRFASLLVEKYSDYQIFLFTHEKDWFDYVAHTVKGKNWLIKRMNWSPDKGVCLEIPLLTLKDRIEDKLGKSDPSDLGNMMRKYLERLLKEICFKLEVKVKFLFNDRNEDRMSYELLSELKSKLEKRKCDIKDAQVLKRLNSSVFIVNKASHDSPFEESLPDLKAFYKDILELEELFICRACNKLIDKRFFDEINKLMRCGCGKVQYVWAK